jgi:hypothetical protein
MEENARMARMRFTANDTNLTATPKAKRSARRRERAQAKGARETPILSKNCRMAPCLG